MGIHGLLPHLGPGQRISLAKLSSQYFITYNRPFRLAIDVSIWLFQIQSGKGGSNPALRTFYYRLLRLMSLSIHPLFVFDGPNKPLFKRNKKVGGPGVKVATVPEFLAKQLLKEFGFPWHVAPGEAEAECALLQREKVVDAVLSEDVDTLMFGSGVTLRNWSQEGTSKGNKPPTHVNVYRADETKEKSRGIDKEGMILVALMSGGDYIPEGVPGVGPKVACDAARAGFGKDLCALHRKDTAGLNAWKQRLETEIRTNASKFFSRKNNGFVVPEDFPNREVLGYYTHPCVSTPEKVERLRREVKWDLDIDFTGLRSFAGDAFDWRCRGGAKKFIKNLAPALLIRELRLRGGKEQGSDTDTEAQEAGEKQMVHAIHGKRNHAMADGELEYRISFTPSTLVPIDLSQEDEDDEYIPAGGGVDDSDVESELLPSTQLEVPPDDHELEAPASPKKRRFRPYEPDQPEKLWILRSFLHAGCPLLVEDYEASTQDPKQFLKQRRQAKAVGKESVNIHAPKAKKKAAQKDTMPQNALMAYARVTKAGATDGSERTMKELSPRANARSKPSSSKGKDKGALEDDDFATIASFKLPSTQIPAGMLLDETGSYSNDGVEVLDLAGPSPGEAKSRFTSGIDPLRPFAAFASSAPTAGAQKSASSQTAQKSKNTQSTPKKNSRKRPPPDFSSPAVSQRTITSYYSPSPQKQFRHIPLPTQHNDIVNLVSSSPAPLRAIEEEMQRPLTPTPPAKSHPARHSASPTPRQRRSAGEETVKLPETVTKRRRKEPLRRWQTEPAGMGMGIDEDGDDLILPTGQSPGRMRESEMRADLTIVISSSPAKSDDLMSPSKFMRPGRQSSRWQDPAIQERNRFSGSRKLIDRTVDMDQNFAGEGGFIRDDECGMDATKTRQSSSYPTPPSLHDASEDDSPVVRAHADPAPPKKATRRNRSNPTDSNIPVSKAALSKAALPKQVKKTKTRIVLRESLEGAWKEVAGDPEPEVLDMTGDGDGSERVGRRADVVHGWRKSEVEVLDLTGV